MDVLGDVVFVANNDPPVNALYHLTVVPFAPAVAVMVPVPQIVVLLAVGAEGIGLMVSVTDCLGVLSQPVVAL